MNRKSVNGSSAKKSVQKTSQARQATTSERGPAQSENMPLKPSTSGKKSETGDAEKKQVVTFNKTKNIFRLSASTSSQTLAKHIRPGAKIYASGVRSSRKHFAASTAITHNNETFVSFKRRTPTRSSRKTRMENNENADPSEQFQNESGDQKSATQEDIKQLQAAEDEATVGNVSNQRISPPDHMGRPKRGHLVFNANFECGNLGRVDYISECEFDLFIRPDTCNPKQRVWFYFSVNNTRKEQRVIFNIVNFSKIKSLYRAGMAPSVRSTSRPTWQRIPPKHVYYYRSPNHNDNYILSFAFAFDREDDVYYFAYNYPYTYTQLQNYLLELEQAKHPFVFRDMIGLSVQQRRVDLITITEPANITTNMQQNVIFITSRVHPGETPASFVVQGLISYLVSDTFIAKRLRENYVFKIIPMLNPDGVFLGNYRSSLMGFDLNRHWQSPSSWAQPTIYAAKSLLMEYSKNPNFKLNFYVDIHSHSTKLSSFMYGNVFSGDPVKTEKQVILPWIMAELSEDFSLDNSAFNMDALKAGTGRRAMGSALDCFCYTLEVSFFGYTKRDNPSVIVPYTEESYKKIGHNLALSFYRFFEADETGQAIQAKPLNTFTALYPKTADTKKKKKTSQSKK